MSLGANTAVVDGQRNLFPSLSAYVPLVYGQQTTGVPQVSPTMPPFLGAANGAGASMGVNDNVGGYGTAGNNAMVTQIAAEHPHSLKVSPVWWAIGSLVVGLVLLRAVHWRKVVEGGEHARVGAATERADAEA